MRPASIFDMSRMSLMTSSRNRPLRWMSREYSAVFIRTHGPEHFGQHHLGEADDGVERRSQLVAHVGEEFRLRAVRGFSPRLLAGIFVGEVGQALGLLVGQQALLLQVAHRHHQFALGEPAAALPATSGR
jgi:hypothetical protein